MSADEDGYPLEDGLTGGPTNENILLLSGREAPRQLRGSKAGFQGLPVGFKAFLAGSKALPAGSKAPLRASKPSLPALSKSQQTR